MSKHESPEGSENLIPPKSPVPVTKPKVEFEGVSSDELEKITSKDHEYVIPKREVFGMDDMKRWHASEAYWEYLGFINAMNEVVKAKPSTGIYKKSESTQKLLEILDTLDSWITEIPPQEQPQRFGNMAFRTWHQKLKDEISQILNDAFPNHTRAFCELSYYLYDSFGNPTRIDYGTGHEMAFCMFLSCLFKVGILFSADQAAVVCYVFSKYLELVRRLQTVYKMEPAGSRGVWALDDYQFVPFIWGSSQLMGHPKILPSSFVKDDLIKQFGDDYMFLGCIRFISQVKSGPFAEHSNQLWNISGVATWDKVNSGLIRMYKAEVLAKFPVVQHVLFGSLMSIKAADLSQMQDKRTDANRSRMQHPLGPPSRAPFPRMTTFPPPPPIEPSPEIPKLS